MNNNNRANKTKAPSVDFKAYNSVEEMEQDELKWLAGLTPEEHLQHATSLIKRVFSEQLEKHPRIGNRIFFD